MSQQLTLRATATALSLALLTGCAATTSTAPTTTVPSTPADISQLYQEPADLASRDLFYGAGGPDLVPAADAPYRLLQKDTGGFSTTYDLEDASGMGWSAKIGPEAGSEVVSSRIVWAMGYHQPPSYYLGRWTLVGAEGTAATPARFRPKIPWLKQVGVWDWRKNPFADSQPLRGLVVLMMILNSTDLKADNNARYEVSAEHGPPTWFVVKDLGATLGDTGALFPRRNYIDAFEQHGFIDRVDSNGRVHFVFKGLHKEILDGIAVDDVRWMCDRLNRLTADQWSAAFRAAEYPQDLADRFIHRLQAKIAEGLALKTSTAADE